MLKPKFKRQVIPLSPAAIKWWHDGLGPTYDDWDGPEDDHVYVWLERRDDCIEIRNHSEARYWYEAVTNAIDYVDGDSPTERAIGYELIEVSYKLAEMLGEKPIEYDFA